MQGHLIVPRKFPELLAPLGDYKADRLYNYREAYRKHLTGGTLKIELVILHIRTLPSIVTIPC